MDIDIKLKSKTDPQTTIYVVVYGVKGNVNNVSVGLWDRLYYYDNDSIKYELSIDMKGKKIMGVGNSTENNDAINKSQLDALDAKIKIVLNALTDLSAIVIENKNDISTIDTNNKNYFFTNYLKHDNENIVKFPSSINYASYQSLSDDDTKLRISKLGYYNIIYSDQYKGDGKFNIYNATKREDLLIIDLDNQILWTPLTINAVVKINKAGDNNYGDIHLKIFNGNAVFDGSQYSTFYNKFLHE